MLYDNLAVLGNWAPSVLALGAAAPIQDLQEILGRRSLVESLLKEKPEAWLSVFEVDRKCEPFAHNLLYLDQDSAASAIEKWEGSSHFAKWFGVHLWPVNSCLEGWSDQISTESLLSTKAHSAEVLQAVSLLETTTPREYFNQAFYSEDGKWLPKLGWWELELLSSKIMESRYD